ncbi:MAG: Na/Pi symporter, partial [Bacteroidota bacterium]
MDKSLYLRGLMPNQDENIALDSPKKPLYQSALLISIAVYFFLLSINLISTSFSLMGSEIAESIIKATANPFVGLFIGLIITAILQSSSTVTTMTIAAVAGGSISFESAIPIIMGANVGTTITSTIVSLGFMPKKVEFRKAISAGTLHD